MDEFGLAVLDWNTAQIFAVELDQIKGAKDGRIVVTPGTEQVKS